MFQDFSGNNLRGRSFKGQDLTGASFSYADIRGADFTNATLTGANFSHAKAGLQHRSCIGLALASLLLSALSVGATVFTVVFAGYLLFPYSINPEAAVIVLGLFAVFFIVTVRQGLQAALGAGTIAAAVLGVVIGIMTGIKVATVAGAVAVTVTAAIAAVGTMAMAITGAMAGAVAGAVAMAMAMAMDMAMAMAGAVAGAVAGKAVAVAIAGTGTVSAVLVRAQGKAVVAAVAGTVVGVLGASYVGWQALAKDEKFPLIRKIAFAFAAIGGTSFRGADLTDANFTQATLKSTDFREANLTGTNLHKAKNLDRARVGNTILLSKDVRDLVVTKRGANKSYTGRNLKGANLAGADLNDADLTEADISGATFEGAWLERTNLTKTQALKTKFNQARLTGACLEAWNIDSTTQLEGVICDYVYLFNNQQERCPSSGNFAPGDFTKLFAKVMNTIDLIFHNGINYDAFIYSWNKLKIENEGTELYIQSIENKGDGVFVVRVDAPADANKAKIHSEFNQNYEIKLKVLEAKYQAKLNNKNAQIAIYRQHQADLKELLKLRILATGTAAEEKPLEGRLVTLRLGKGNWRKGFPVTLQIGVEGARPSVEVMGELPSEREIPKYYSQWRSAYRRILKSGSRLDVPATQVTNVSRSEFFEVCNESAESLRKNLNLWLNSPQFSSIRERLLEKLTASESIRIILQTESSQLWGLPWHLWDFFERYPKAEIALSTPGYERIEKILSAKTQVKILAILGNSKGIDIQKDRAILEQLPNAEVTFLVEPQRQELNEQLWCQPWDILFFAGHSSSSANGETGQIYINRTDNLTIPQLKHALKKAIEYGLKLAILNSCDGLGLARNLADLQIPQMIVMREPVPDQVAQEFLKNFLAAFSSGKTLYYSVREAREKLQGLEEQFPCATWLPVICQNPAEIPRTWREFRSG